VLPADPASAVRAGIKEYLRSVEAEDWPATAVGRMTPRASPPSIEDMPAALLSFVLGKPGEQVARQNAVVAVEHALEAIEATQNRIMLTKVVIFPAQSAVVFALDMPILPTVAMVHIDRRVTAAADLPQPPAAWLVPPMVDDRPFAAGGVTLVPGCRGRSAPASLDGKPPLDAGTLERVGS
jgi:hypothetical protein